MANMIFNLYKCFSKKFGHIKNNQQYFLRTVLVPVAWSNQGFVRSIMITLFFVLTGCSSIERATNSILPKTASSILHAAVVADEPTAVLTARDMLARGGNAADAAVGLYFTLAVTFPSQAGIGSGGTCMVYDPRVKTVKVLDFSHTPTAVVGDKLSIPMSVRGMAWLHARFGRLSWASLLNRVASIAREGVTTSRGFINDLESEVPRLANDATALSLFFDRLGLPFGEGIILQQIELGAVLGNIAARGAGVFYRGALAKRIILTAGKQGQKIDHTALSIVKPRWLPAKEVRLEGKSIFLPVTENQNRAAAFWQRFSKKRDYTFLKTRTGAVDLAKALGPASAKKATANVGSGFVVVDGDGLAVVCSVTTGRKFGTGKFLPGLGFALSPINRSGSNALLLAIDSQNHKFLFGASGYSNSAGATALTGVSARVLLSSESLKQASDHPRAHINHDGSIILEKVIHAGKTDTVDYSNTNISFVRSIGRINAIYCPNGLPPASRGDPACQVKADRRGNGVGTRFKKDIRDKF